MTKLFKVLSAVTVLTLCVSATAFASTYDQYNELQQQIKDLTGQSERMQDEKIVRSSEEMVNFTAGETRDVVVTVTNIGDWAAKNISVTASLGANDVPLAVDLASNSQTIATLSKNSSRDIDLKIRANNTAETGVYTVNLNFTYRASTSNKITTDTVELHVKVTGDELAPELVVRDFSAAPEKVFAGDNFKLTANLQNAGGADARDVQVLVEGLDPEKIYLSGASNNQYYGALRASANQELSFSLTANSSIKSGSYPLVFKVKYRDQKNEVKESAYTYYVNISGADDSTDRASLAIAGMPALGTVYGVGEQFTIAFAVENTGAATAKNITITAKTDDGGAVVPKSANIKSIAQLAPGAVSQLSFSFAPTSKASTQNYVIGFKVEYETGVKDGDTQETAAFEQFAGVNVSNPDSEDEDAAKISKPKIIIDSYKVEPIIVKAGQEFDLSMVFKNTHATKSIENIKAVLTPNEATENSGSVFMPVNGSNTFYISKIAPGATATENFRMYAIPAADPRTYTITVQFSYQDSEYNEYTESEIIGVTVKQTTKLDTGNIMMPTEGYMFSPLNINFNLMNTGKSTLNNLTVEIKGNFDVSKSFMYFGSLNKSASSYYDGEITPQEPGMQEGTILISYEDEAGEVTVIEHDFVINVMDMAPMPDFGMEFPMEDMSQPGFTDKLIGYAKNPFVWVGVVCVGAAGFAGKKFYDKKRRPKFDE